MLILTQEGANALLRYILKLTTPPNPYLHLIGSPIALSHTTTLANLLAVELPLANGYAPIQLTPPGSIWTLNSITAGAQAQAAAQNWTFTGALNVLGYWLSDDTNNWSWWAELLVPSFTFPAGGGPFGLVAYAYEISCPGVSAC